MNNAIDNAISTLNTNVADTYVSKSYLENTYTRDVVESGDATVLEEAKNFAKGEVQSVESKINEVKAYAEGVHTTLTDLIGANGDGVINKFNEIQNFLNGYSEVDQLKSLFDGSETRSKQYTDAQITKYNTEVINPIVNDVNDKFIDVYTAINKAKSDLTGVINDAIADYEVPVMTTTQLGVAKIGYSSNNNNLAINKDSGNNLYTTITAQAVETALGYTPLKSSDLTTAALPAATTAKIGGIKIGYTDTGSNVKVNLDGNNNAYVSLTSNAIETAIGYKPGKEYVLQRANVNELGGIKVGFAESDYQIPVQLDGNGRAFVSITDNAITSALGYTPYDKELGESDVNRLATATLVGGIRIGYTSSDTNKAVLLNNGQAYVTVPTATTTAYGTVKLGSDTTVTVTPVAATAGTANRVYPVQKNSDNKLVVNVPWVDNDTIYPYMTSSVSGLGRLFSDNVQTTAANAVTTTGERTYGIQRDANNRLVVNVPWTNTTYGNAT